MILRRLLGHASISVSYGSLGPLEEGLRGSFLSVRSRKSSVASLVGSAYLILSEDPNITKEKFLEELQKCHPYNDLNFSYIRTIILFELSKMRSELSSVIRRITRIKTKSSMYEIVASARDIISHMPKITNLKLLQRLKALHPKNKISIGYLRTDIISAVYESNPELRQRREESRKEGKATFMELLDSVSKLIIANPGITNKDLLEELRKLHPGNKICLNYMRFRILNALYKMNPEIKLERSTAVLLDKA